MKTSIAVVFSLVALANVASLNMAEARGQHCAPIVESYLQSVSVKHVENELSFDVEYKKTGGRRHESYQAYLLAFSHVDADRLARMTPQEAIEAKLVSVVHTQVAKRQDDGCYRIHGTLDAGDFVAAMLRESRFSQEQIEDFGGWKSFRGRVRLAVFIPFLDDKKYSVLEGLSADRHECNYRGESALIFEILPPKISAHFGIVEGGRIPEGHYKLQLNGHRPAPQAKSEVKTPR